MSRLIVKNLPTYITDQRLRDNFSQQPSTSANRGSGSYTLTDARIARKPDGTSRKFAFVGYKTHEEAERAKAWWDRTYIDGSRINVEVVEEKHEPRKRKTGDENAPPDPRTSSTTRPSKDGQSELKKDTQKDKFVNAMTTKSKTRTWADDILPLPDSAKPEKHKKKVKGSTDDAVNGFAHDDRADAAEEDEARAEGISDLEWMRRRMTKSLEADAEGKDFEQSDEEDVPEHEEPAEPKLSTSEAEKQQSRETILSTGRLFLRNLAYTCTSAELEEHFAPYGEIQQVHLPLTPARRPSGLAFITFAKPDDALKVYEELDGAPFQGRLLHILAAVDKRPRPNADAGGPKSLKDKKLEDRKKQSGRGWDWAVLYMNPDAVAAAVAAKLGVQKSEILNAEDGNAAVKLALAETSLVQETKTYLETNGVDFTAFSQRTARSPTTILVKNLPAFTTAQQIRELFAPHGELKRVLVPPSGAIALVEFENESEAGVAWRNVNYRRFGGSIVYLERGPSNLWKAGAAPADASIAAQPAIVTLPEDEEPQEAAPGSMLYIKNLSFATASDTLSSLFSSLPGFVYARVQTKPNPKDPNARLSMGYGFVGFKSREEAERARKAMDGATCDGHKLSVRFAGRGKDEAEQLAPGAEGGIGIGNRKTTKMIVKNVPFEATKADIRSLFQGYGQLKSVRLPTKFDRRTRGFAFLEFVSRREAETAMAALKHTHLLGRHLVLEWAEDEQGMETLREKTKRAFGDGKEVPNKRRKLQIGEGEEAEASD
ncbi:RNA-binding domain-containing protein [Calocera cornea HHB12733]|uniref:RNA-binding domain-containing protein n=1 Tax=Calocera cornea HHB12733 TaxID=1353952 RepID=A0A165GK97_9BASI|nr:RNA-binding domain-containing protein [Calocera cornea HHB12733]